MGRNGDRPGRMSSNANVKNTAAKRNRTCGIKHDRTTVSCRKATRTTFERMGSYFRALDSCDLVPRPHNSSTGSHGTTKMGVVTILAGRHSWTRHHDEIRKRNPAAASPHQEGARWISGEHTYLVPPALARPDESWGRCSYPAGRLGHPKTPATALPPSRRPCNSNATGRKDKGPAGGRGGEKSRARDGQRLCAGFGGSLGHAALALRCWRWDLPESRFVRREEWEK